MTTIQALVTTSPTSLATLVSQAGSADVDIFITQPQIISSDLTIPSSIVLKVLFGGSVAPTTGHTLTLNCKVTADPFAWIDLSGGGTVTFNSGNNYVQRDFYADWWALPYAAPSTDASTILNAMLAAIPDYSTITFSHISSLYLQNPWTFTNRTGIIVQTSNLIEELPQFSFNSIGGLFPAFIHMNFCGHCTIQGFSFNDTVGINGILCEQHGGGGIRISTNNTFAYNVFNNNSASSNWVGISIAPSGDANNEGMQFLHNFFFGNGTATAGLGTGIYVGAGSNNHMHYLFRNQTYGCRYGVTGIWSGYYASNGVSESDQVAYSIGHMSYPTVIEFQDLEGTATFVENTGGGESSLQIKYARVAGDFQNSVAIFDFSTLFNGPILIEGCDYQNYSGGSPYLYQVPYTANGSNPSSLTLINNNYGNFENEGFPNANYIHRVGTPVAGQPIYEIFADAEGLTGSFADTKSINRTIQTIAANNVNVTADVTGITGGGTLNTFTLALSYASGLLTAPEKLFKAVIWAQGSSITIASGVSQFCFKTGGTIAANTMQTFMYDPATQLWYWAN